MRGQATSQAEPEITSPVSGEDFHWLNLGAPESELAYFHWRVTILGRGGDLKLIIP